MASADLRAELVCSVCLNTYTNPVTLKCGHSFCRECIDLMMDAQEGYGVYSCPECRAEFQERPALQRNITQHNIVENVLSAQPDKEESGIFCTYCIHAPVPAVKSCLLCEASLCDNHLRVHSKSAEHILCDLTTSLENMKCSIHKKILEYYCTEDSACICVSCSLAGEHRGHQVETLDEASEKKKKKWRNILQKLMTEREETEKRVQSLEEHRKKVQGKAAGETERVTALLTDLRRCLEDLEKRVLSDISGQAERISLHVTDIIRKLEIKKDELPSKMRHIEELCNLTDPLTVLQEPDTGDLCDTEDGDDEDRERHDKLLHGGGDLDVAWITHTLHTGISDIMSGVIVQEEQTLGVSGVTDILLDVNTASNNLQISDDRKSASWSLKSQKHPETPERFQHSQVLSSQSFSSGRHYWEVDVGGSKSWIVGMCYPSIERRGLQSGIGDNKKSWSLERSHTQYSVRHDNNQIPLLGNVSSKRVRIDLDYEAGRISFYDLCDPIRHLHTFTTTFNEPLHAGLYVGKGCIKISGGESDESDAAHIISRLNTLPLGSEGADLHSLELPVSLPLGGSVGYTLTLEHFQLLGRNACCTFSLMLFQSLG
ncbi:PREDICTED: tripartite motif-containing protein 7-like [Nanorana parkeri]|uniref:tripartite motif-containing protein 7-like n=1 Tax=Nanorana parkeri TaxID=125878 RepID=UPI0008547AAC|nr:PREDICTED: tripartite motif-containing protein 7-like [Nanorana parkeri]